MNRKKLSLAALSLALSASLLAGCTGGGTHATPSATPAATPSASPVETGTTPPAADGAAVKTGLSVMTDLTSSKNAAADAEGLAQANIVLVAVTVGEDGVIDACAIDAVQSKVNFDTKGAIVTDLAATFPSKNELGDEYGMRKASQIGKEWNEQAAAFAEYAVGKTLADLKGVAVNEKGAATGADLTASVTIPVSDFLAGIEAAVNSATDLGAKKGDKLGLSSSTNIAKSKPAAADAEGLAQGYATIAAVTSNGGTISSCVIDAVQANVNFDAAGVITTDLTAPVDSKNVLGDAYGMRKASQIGKEWNEQAAAFAEYTVGKTVADLKGVAVNEKGVATEADLAASITISLGEFTEVIEKAVG